MTGNDPVASLTVAEKCLLLGGASAWRTHPIERLGIPALKMSDGPNGVRGEARGATSTPGVAVPVGIALGATWDPAIVAEVGDLLGREAVRKGAHVLLAPTINLQRTPIGGRVFECMSEDPELTAALAVAYVHGVQAHGVAVTLKHFAANDTEVDRMSVNVEVDETTLRHLYLRPFEAAVIEGGAWGVMSAYNRLRGSFCAESRALLHDILRSEWNFDGVVVSDWHGAHDTVGCATAGLNVPMPGPRTVYGSRLEAAVEAGEVSVASLDALVSDVLVLAERTRAAARPADRPEESIDDPADRDVCRRAATAGTVLLRNTGGVLPIDPHNVGAVAVIGPNAADTRVMGGGSASLRLISRRSVLDALKDRLPGRVVHEPGVRITTLTPLVGGRRLGGPDGGTGWRVVYRNEPDGPPVAVDTNDRSLLSVFGSTPDGVNDQHFWVEVSGTFVPEVDGPHRVGVVVTGPARVQVGPRIVVDDPGGLLPRGLVFFGYGSEEQTVVIDCTAGVPVPVTATMEVALAFGALRIGVAQPEPADLFGRAVRAAAEAEVAVVVVGTNEEHETEGHDRDSIHLPGEQDALIRAVAAANPSTVVVCNVGSPVAMPWIDEVAAVVVPFFGGMEMGTATAEVLCGDSDPGGRLPVTFPHHLADTPAWPWYAPVDGTQTYGEGLRMGYRGFGGVGEPSPLFPFGHGLSYGTAEWGAVAVDRARTEATALTAGETVRVSVPVTGTGDRDTTVVVQAYLTRPHGPRQLVGFAKATVGPGSTVELVIPLGFTAFRQWVPATPDASRSGDWQVVPGEYTLDLGASAGQVHQRVGVVVR